MTVFAEPEGSGSSGADLFAPQVSDIAWERLFVALLDNRHFAAGSAETEELIRFVRDGSTPSSFVNPQPGRWSMEEAFTLAHRLVSASGRRAVRLLLAIAIRLDEEQRDRFGLFCRPWNGWSTFEVVSLALGGEGHPVSLVELEHIGEHLGWPTGALFDHVTQQTYRFHHVAMLSRLPDFSGFVGRNIDGWIELLSTPAQGHEFLWPAISAVDPAVLELLGPVICDVATRTPKKVAAAAVVELRRLPLEQAEEHLKGIARSAKPAQRARAVAELVDLTQGPDRVRVVDWFEKNLANDRSSVVQAAIAQLCDTPPADPKPSLPSIDLPVIAELPVDPAMKLRNLDLLLSAVNGQAGWQSGWLALDVLTSVVHRSPASLSALNRFHFARVLLVMASQVHHMQRSLTPVVDFAKPLEFSAVAAADGIPETAAVQVVASLNAVSSEIWSDRELTDFVAYHPEAFADLLQRRVSSYEFDRASLFTLITRIAIRPPRLDRALIEAAVGGFKSDRSYLYRIVGSEHVGAVLPSLASKKRGERIGVADWVRHHGTAEAAEPLRAAIRREKDDGAKAAMLAALEVLGEDLDEFLGADVLLSDAKKALTKKNAIPKAIDWLDLDALPPLEWADGSPVAREIVSWFIVMAVKAKSAEPSPILRRHFDNMAPELVRAFGATVLDIWMAEDLRKMSEEEAQAQGRQQAPHYHRWAQQGSGPYAGMTLQQVTDVLVADARKQMAGSATTSKGLLAVVAASAGPEVADGVLAYIRKYRGQRVHQAKALLEMLAWIDEPATVQAVMSVATRFRPKGIQVEAGRQAELLAERHGWTLDDLADRSVPDGGFGTDGRLVFDYGERTFTAHLNDDLTIRLLNDSTGKVVRSLPAGRAGEDTDHVKGIKSDFTAAKKELKTTLAIQPSRLHASMCTQRTWSPDDFSRYFVQHPVMNRLATRLIWLSVVDDSAVAFRPMSDGTLIGADDEDVIVDPKARISLAHEQLVEAGIGDRWQTHFADYEVAPLFGQFGRPAVGYDQGQTLITDFVGYGHNDGSLRGQMNRQAWQLGVPQDGGVAFEIIKDVPTAGLTGVVELLGGLPAGAYDVGSWPCFLGQMYFVPTGERYVSGSSAVKLERVPPVLLTEFYAEVQAMALAGSGFDPDHDKKH